MDENYQIIFPQSVEFVTFHCKNWFAHWPVTHETFNGMSFYKDGVDASWWKNHYMSNSMFAYVLKVDFIACYDLGRNAGTMLTGNHNIIKGGKFWLWPGLVFGTVLFHCIIEVIYAFDLRALVKHPVQMLAILAVTALLMVGMQKDVLGYDRWLPDESKVASAGLIDYGNSAAELTEKENIAALCRLAEIGREATLNADSNDTGTVFLESHSLQFAMQNGTVKTRSYKLPVSEEVRSLLNKVYGSSEYKLKSSSLYDLDLDNAHVIDMTFCVNQLKYNSETITDGEKAAEIVKTLREERLTYTELAKPVMWFNITTDAEANNYANGIVTDRDVKTLALIKKYFGLEPQSIAPDTVSQFELDFYVPAEDTWVGLNVTDRADIAALLKDAVATGTMRMYGNSDLYDLTSFKDNARVNVTPAVEDD